VLIAASLPDSNFDPVDDAPFAATLARRLAGAVEGGGGARGGARGGGGDRGRLGASGASGGARSARVLRGQKSPRPGSRLWRAAVDGVLLPACAGATETHEEVLRLILAAAGSMSDDALATLVEGTLHVTRKSRKQRKQRRKPVAYEHEPLPASVTGRVVAGRLGGGTTRRGSGIGLAGAARFDSTGSLTGVGGAFEAGTRLDSSGSLAAFGNNASSFPAAGGRGGSVGDFGGYASGDVARSGADTDGGLNARGGVDGVRATYQLLAQREAGRLTEATAPRLHEYLARREKGGNAARGAGGNARGERDAERADEEMRDEGPGENAPFSP
jgi:negative elongation factor B